MFITSVAELQWQECVLAGWYHLLSPEVGESKHLPVDTDDQKENEPSLGE